MKTYFQLRQQLDENRKKSNFASILAATALTAGAAGGGLAALERSAANQKNNQIQTTIQPEAQHTRQVTQQPRVQPQEDKEGIDIAGIAKTIRNYESAGASHEKISRPFKDHKGKLTIGHGHLITDNSEDTFRKAFPEEHKTNPHFGKQVLASQKALTADQMERLMHHDISTRIPQLHKMIPTFHKLPKRLQHELASEHYRGGLGLAKKTIKLFNAGKTKEAAAQWLNSDEYREAVRDQTGVATRYNNLHKEILNYHK